MMNKESDLMRRLVFVENQINDLPISLTSSFLKGRLRTDRAAPSSSADVQSPDQLYDIVINASYIYLLIDNSGALAWRRVSISTF
jgi:hypothetical protein